VECAVTDINTDQTIYTGQGEHIDWIVELDFRGAVRAALANLPAAGAIGRLATASDIAVATAPPSAAPQQGAAPRSTPTAGQTGARGERNRRRRFDPWLRVNIVRCCARVWHPARSAAKP